MHRDEVTLTQLFHIAEECNEFEHVISAMGYGYSLLNVSEANYERRCDYCVHWQDGFCEIFQREIKALGIRKH